VKTMTSAPNLIVLVLKPFPSAKESQLIERSPILLHECLVSFWIHVIHTFLNTVDQYFPEYIWSVFSDNILSLFSEYIWSVSSEYSRSDPCIISPPANVRDKGKRNPLTLTNCSIGVFPGIAQAHALSDTFGSHSTSIICSVQPTLHPSTEWHQHILMVAKKRKRNCFQISPK
jgi:hypothetical protein